MEKEAVTLKTPPVVSGALPGIGHLLEFSRNRPGIVMRGQKEHGNIFTVKQDVLHGDGQEAQHRHDV